MTDWLKSLDDLSNRDHKAAIVLPFPLDIDGLASGLVLQDFLEELGFEVKIYSEKPISDYLKTITRKTIIYKEFKGKQKVVFLIDAPTSRQVSFFEKVKQLPLIILIDHHAKSDLHKIAQLKIWQQNWSSAAEGIFHLISSKGKITAHSTTLLLLAIMADTGRLQYRATVDTFKIASRLLSLGANLAWINSVLNYRPMSVNQLRLWGLISQKIRLIKGWDLAFSLVMKEDIKELGCREEEILGAVNLISNSQIASISLLLIEKNGLIKGTIRSNSKEVEAGELARLFGGDGFDRAAGFSFSGKFVKKDSRVIVE